MSDPKGFLKFTRSDPDKRAVHERIRDFKEMVQPLYEEKLKNQGARCMDCGVPFCNSATGCPVENLIPDWNDLVHRGKFREALKSLHSTNNFPEFTGRLCPAPCESVCILGIHQDPVSIRSIEQSIVDRGFEEGWVKPLPPEVELKKSVAIVGSGPAGLAAAQELRRKGYSVTVYEKADKLGGLLRYGIPDFKMEKSVLDRRLEQMADEGVQFQTSVEIGKDISLSDLKRKHQAIGLAIGSEKPRDILVPGRELNGIHFAMDYLIQQNRRVAGLSDSELQKSIHARGKNVVILGGGDTGSDCLGTALRQGALKVTQIEINSRPMKVKSSHAHEEGGVREWGVITKMFSGKNNQVEQLHAVRTENPHAEFLIPADLVLIAAGFVGVQSNSILESIQLTPQNTLKVDRKFRTNLPGVFASGDATRGASLIVWAIAEGRKMSESIHAFLSEELNVKKATSN